jgi:hypothetical protein
MPDYDYCEEVWVYPGFQLDCYSVNGHGGAHWDLKKGLRWERILDPDGTGDRVPGGSGDDSQAHAAARVPDGLDGWLPYDLYDFILAGK